MNYDNFFSGALGDCWLLSSLSVLADRSDIIERVFLNKSVCNEGICQIFKLLRALRYRIKTAAHAVHGTKEGNNKKHPPIQGCTKYGCAKTGCGVTSLWMITFPVLLLPGEWSSPRATANSCEWCFSGVIIGYTVTRRDLSSSPQIWRHGVMVAWQDFAVPDTHTGLF